MSHTSDGLVVARERIFTTAAATLKGVCVRVRRHPACFNRDWLVVVCIAWG